MQTERRQKRSENPVEATRHLLTQAKDERSYVALNVSSEAGELFVGAPTNLNNSALSMVAPLAGEGEHIDSGFLKLVTKGDGLKVWRVPLDGEDVFLCAVGGPVDYPRKTITAIKRILTAE